jgi:DNA-binding NarL/FixJ family response regulator
MSPRELSPRQREVAALIADGSTSKQIAARLGISTRRVRIHVTALAYLIDADPSKSIHVQIALWWRRHTDRAA